MAHYACYACKWSSNDQGDAIAHFDSPEHGIKVYGPEWANVAEGQRIELVSMGPDPDPMPAGARGTVLSVVDTGDHRRQLQVDWDIDRSLCLVSPHDHFRVLTDHEVEIESERHRIRETGKFFV